MRALCKEHNLVLSPDGTCVLCRRAATNPIFQVTEEEQGWTERLLSVLLLVCLLAAVAYLGRVAQLPPFYTGPPEGSIARGVTSEPGTLLPVSEPAPAPAPAAAKTDDAAVNDTPAEASAGGPDPALAAGPALVLPAPDAGTPSVTKAALRKVMGEVEVTLYTSPWCSICDQAEFQLKHMGVALTVRDVESDEEAKQRLRKVNTAATLPTIEIGAETLVGYNPYMLDYRVEEAAKQHLK